MIGHPGLLISVYPQHSPEESVQVSGAVPLLHFFEVWHDCDTWNKTRPYL